MPSYGLHAGPTTLFGGLPLTTIMRALSQRDIGLAVWLLLGLLVAAIIALALFSYIGAFLFAIFLYYATRPLYRRLNGYIDRPNLTVTFTLLIVILPMLLVVGYAVVIALQELDQFLATHSLGQYRAYLQPYLSLVREGKLQRLGNTLVSNPGNAPGSGHPPSASAIVRTGEDGPRIRFCGAFAVVFDERVCLLSPSRRPEALRLVL